MATKESLPSPVNFEQGSNAPYAKLDRSNLVEFVPCAFRQLQQNDCTVIQTHVDYEPPKRNITKNKSTEVTHQDIDNKENVKHTKKVTEKKSVDHITIVASYDSKYLVEIALSKGSITPQLIMILSMCLGHQPYLYKLKAHKTCKLNQQVIYQIGKALPQSFITEVIFDDMPFRQNNYYTLLDNPSSLTRLSLNRCRIGDGGLEEIMIRLEYGKPASKTLKILELSTNQITDDGAKTIARALRRNRCLLHLNLAGNPITSDGGIAILSILTYFSLTDDENYERYRRKNTYLKEKIELVDEYLANIVITSPSKVFKKTDKQSRHTKDTKSTQIAKDNKQGQKKPPVLNDREVAETRAESLMGGPFIDPYDDNNIFKENNVVFCKGNFQLCTLNLAFNDLDYTFLKKLSEVLMLQGNSPFKGIGTGLIRVILDGNHFPRDSEEITWIRLKLLAALERGQTKKKVK